MGKVYGVKFGRKKTGEIVKDVIYENWADCGKVVTGVSGALYQSFQSYQEALKWLNETDTHEYINGTKIREIATNDQLKRNGFNKSLLNKNTKSMVLNKETDPERRRRRFYFVNKVSSNEFIKEYLLKKQSSKCAFCYNLLKQYDSVVHHIDYDHLCIYGEDNCISIKKNNSMIYGVPNCAKCFSEHPEAFVECEKRLSIIHKECNKKINDYIRGAEIKLVDKNSNDNLFHHNNEKVQEILPFDFCNEKIAKKTVDIFVQGSWNNINSSGYYKFQVEYVSESGKKYLKQDAKLYTEIESDLEIRLKGLRNAIRCLNTPCNICIHVSTLTLSNIVIVSNVCKSSTEILKLKQGKLRNEIITMLYEGKHTYQESIEKNVSSYLDNIKVDGISKHPSYYIKRRYNNDSL